jgi:ABC-type Zn2+ transport system substrate-binding protein/surface adhesin
MFGEEILQRAIEAFLLRGIRCADFVHVSVEERERISPRKVRKHKPHASDRPTHTHTQHTHTHTHTQGNIDR